MIDPEDFLLRSFNGDMNVTEALKRSIGQSGDDVSDGVIAIVTSLDRRARMGHEIGYLDAITVSLSWCWLPDWVPDVLPLPPKRGEDLRKYLGTARPLLIRGISLDPHPDQVDALNGFFTDWYLGLSAQGRALILSRSDVFHPEGTERMINTDILPDRFPLPPFNGLVLAPEN